MKHTHLLLAAGVLIVLVGLRSALSVLPWGSLKATIWLVAVALLSALIAQSIRTARRVRSAAPEEVEQAVYSLAFLGLVLVTLALSLPHYLPR